MKAGARILSLVLTIVMMLGMLPISAAADEGSGDFQITTTALDPAFEKTPYSFQMHSNKDDAGGTVTWAFGGGNNVAFSLSPDGLITGTYNFSLSGTHRVDNCVIIAKYTPAGSNVTQTARVTLPLTVYSSEPYQVTMNPNGGRGDPVTVYVPPVEPLDLSPYQGLFSKECSVQTGWTYRDGQGHTTTYAMDGSFSAEQNSILFAEWTDILYTITFDLNGGAGAEGADYDTLTHSAVGNKPIKLPAAPTRDGYTFAGWSEDGGAALRTEGYYYLRDLTSTEPVITWDGDTPSASANINFVAQWQGSGPDGQPEETPVTAKTVRLTAQNSGGAEVDADFAWYSDAGGRIRIGTGPAFTFPEKQTVYVRATPKGSGIFQYDASAITAVNGASPDIVALVLPAISVERAAVSGTVKQGDMPLSGVTVSASQTYGGMACTLTATTDSSGEYSFTGDNALFAGSVATFAVTSGGQRLGLTSGNSVRAPIMDGTTNNIGVGSSVLSAEIVLSTISTEEQVSRYLNALGKTVSLKVSGGESTDTAWASLTGASGLVRATLYSVKDESVDCTLSGNAFADSSKPVMVSSGAGAVSFAPALYSGVVVSLGSQTTGSYFLAWYDSGGNSIGRSERFTLSNRAQDIASVCPAESKAGSFTVVLVPSTLASILEETTLNGLTEDQRITQWSVTLGENAVTELDAFTVDSVTSANALYVTKPNSTLSASSESFSGENEIIRFTGTIGLDAGLANGKLTDLTINPKDSIHGYGNTAPVQYLSIGGNIYPAQQTTAWGYYSYHFPEAIDLPCDYTVYCKPGSVDWDMHVLVQAGGSYTGGSFSGETVGEATVSRPGAYISTPSTYVNKSPVTVEGMAKENETVEIYDNDVYVGTAAADRFGEWTAQVPLYGADTGSGGLTTAHVLYAISASGVRSRELMVIHQADGPELTSFTMSYRKYNDGSLNTMDVGDAYLFTGSLYDTTFSATFSNPGRLGAMEEWNNRKVVFKVYTTDGEIRFLEASGDGPVFTATVDTVLRSSVVRAEVLYTPVLSAHEGDVADPFRTSAAEDSAIAVAAAVLRAQMASLDKMTSADSFSIDFTGAAPVVTGKVPSTASADEITAGLREAAQAYAEAGLNLKTVNVTYGDDTSTLSWFNAIAEKHFADSDGHSILYGRTALYKSREDYERAMEAVGAVASEHRVLEGTDCRTDLFILTDTDFDENDELTGTYLASVMFLSDTAAGESAVYLSTASALLGGDFNGYSITAGSAQTRFERLPGSAGAASAPLLYAGTNNFNGNYRESSKYSASCDAEGGLGNISSVLSFGGAAISYVPDVANAAITNAGIGQTMGNISVIGTGVSTYFTFKNNEHRQKISNDMFDDMIGLMFSSCIDKLTAPQREIAENAFKRFRKARMAQFRSDSLVSVVSVLGNSAGTVLNFIPGAQGVGMNVTAVTAVVSNGGGAIVGKDYDKLIQSYNTEYNTIKKMIRLRATQTGDKDCMDGPDGDGKNNNVGNDPSGIVYEGVIENPVEGADVTLYYGADAAGNLVTQDNSAAVTQLVPASDVRNLIPQKAVQTTGENGRYSWGVPEGVWYVTAEYAGRRGDSNADSAAVVGLPAGIPLDGKSVTNLLPVLPVQLDVNIPLVNTAPPVVEAVRYTEQGIYVTFSRYMTEGSGAASVLDRANYSIISDTSGTALKIAEITGVERGHVPSNIGGDETTYTRTVLIRTQEDLTENMPITLGIKGSVTSYANAPMGEDYSGSGSVQAQTRLDQPAFTGTDASGNTFSGTSPTAAVNRCAAIMLELPAGAPAGTKIYYTTDGSEPSKESKLYEGPISVTNNMIVKAVAACAGYTDSEFSTGTFTVAETLSWTVSGKVAAFDGASTDGLTLTLSGGNTYTATVTDGSYAFVNVPLGSYTLSFQGNSDYAAISKTVTVEDNNVNIILRLEKSTPDGSPAIAENKPFTDVAENAWYYDAVYFCYDRGLMNGMSETVFSPDVATSRAMTVTMLWRMEGKPVVNYALTFADVKEGQWYADAVRWAACTGLVNGYSEEAFGPNDNVKREQLATILYRYTQSKGRGFTGSWMFQLDYPDAGEVSGWADEAMHWMVMNGVINGMDGRLNPQGETTRAQVATMLMRYDALGEAA